MTFLFIKPRKPCSVQKNWFFTERTLACDRTILRAPRGRQIIDDWPRELGGSNPSVGNWRRSQTSGDVESVSLNLPSQQV